MKPKFSVIIPSYNHEKYIGGAINSVINQTLKDWELIVIDDGSTDNSFEIINSFNDSRIRLFTQTNHDAPYTINRGMKKARGEYFAILNSDDLFEPSKLEKCYEALVSEKYDFAFGKIKVIDENDQPISPKDERVQWINQRLNDSKAEHSLDKLLLNINYYITTSNFSFSRKVFQEVGFFHEKLHFCHDFDYVLRIFSKSLKTIFITEYLTNYRLHSDNTLLRGTSEPYLEASYAVARFLRNNPYFLKKYTLSFFQYPVFIYALSCFFSLSDSEMDEVISNKESTKRKKIIELIKKSLNVEVSKDIPKDISCILTLHGEGMIAHKAIRSINRAVKYAEQHGLRTELVIVLDRATSETRRYVETSSVIDPAACIISTDFGDPGLARNAGIERACGEYVAIIDGDDLISENWLVRAYKVNRLSPCYVIHPEVNVVFDQETRLFYSPDQHQEDFDESNIIVENYWTALIFCRREIFLLNPYSATPLLSGFGFEDWHWNCEVMARGCIHKTAPGSACFYRIKEKGGRNAEARSRNVLIRHSALFDNLGSRSVRENGVFSPFPTLSGTTALKQGQGSPVHCFRAMLEKMAGSLISRLPMKIRRAIFSAKMPPDWDDESYLSCNPDVKAAVENGILSSGFEHWMRYGRLEGRRLSGVKIPKWLSDEMFPLSDIEPKLFPSRAFFHTLTEYRPKMEGEAGPLYIQLLEEIGDQSFTHVFLLPWLKAGGADLEALHLIRTLSSEFGAQIIVLLTEDTDSPWLKRLPESVTKLHFGRAASRLNSTEAQVVLARLLLKIQPAVIHNINSAIGWQIFCKYGAALCSESRLYASLFCFDYTIEQEPVGYARELEKAHPYLQSVLTDNQLFANNLMELYGLQDSLFSVLRYPVRVVPRFAYFKDGQQPKILWAGRLDRQKRPDILQKIAESLPDCKFHVFGDRLLDRSNEITQTYKALRKMKNVTLFGSYSDFDAISTNNYALFLYTSQWDGLPNVVLEALASGLVVLAPDVGGIHEVIPSDSGFLIDRFDDVQAYVEAIRRVTVNPQLIFAEREKRLKLLREQYSPEAFIASLGNMPLYTTTSPKKEASLIGSC